MKKHKITVTRTAAELAKALGLTPADGAEIALRSDLNSKIVEVVQRKGLTHAQVARLAPARRLRSQEGERWQGNHSHHQRARRLARSAKPMPDSKLDLSDIPESTDAELRRARRVGRPASGNAKQLIAIRIAPQLLRQLRRMAAKQSKPYQTLIHELLEKSTRKVA